MTYLIEVEEKASTIHRILVEVENDEELDRALDEADSAHDFGSYLDKIENCVEVLAVNENYYQNGETIEYWDSHLMKETKENT